MRKKLFSSLNKSEYEEATDIRLSNRNIDGPLGWCRCWSFAIDLFWMRQYRYTYTVEPRQIHFNTQRFW